MTSRDSEQGRRRVVNADASTQSAPAEDELAEREAPSSMELSSMPLDPIYAWGIVLEPVEDMIEYTADFVVHLAQETYQRDESFSDEELEDRFLVFFDRLVEEGTLKRLPDASPEMGRRILGPGRWLEGQRIRIQRLIEHWQEQDARSPGPLSARDE